MNEPIELQQIDLKELQAKIIVNKDETITCSIDNPVYKFKIRPYKCRNKEELKLIMKYRLFKYKLERNEIRFCDCGNLILDKRKYIDLCKECSK